jgi:hypothetical protein
MKNDFFFFKLKTTRKESIILIMINELKIYQTSKVVSGGDALSALVKSRTQMVPTT